MSEDDDTLPNEPAVTAPAEPENQSEAEAPETPEASADGGGEGDPPDAKTETDEGEKDDDAEKPRRESRSARYQRQLERLRAENADLRARSGSQAPAELSRYVEQVIGDPPKEADFKGDYLAFERAMTAYETDKRLTTRDVQRQAQAQQAKRAEVMQDLAEAHRDRVEEFRGHAKDFDSVMRKASDLKTAPVVEELILESDKSAHIAYYLAKNPAKLDALNRMNERQAAREIGRIESGLSLPQAKTTTQAPPPVKHPKGAAAPSTPEKDLDAWLKKQYE